MAPHSCRSWEVYTTHASVNALGAVVLYTTALDAALTEIITWRHLFDRAEREHALKSLTRKCGLLVASDEPDAVLGDLGCLSDLRDELVHYLPRSVRSRGNVPSWLMRLHERELFIATGRNADFSFSQKLGSYALGYWAASIADAVVQRVLKAAPTSTDPSIECIAHNAGLYKNICAPQHLAAYDDKHGLCLTPTESR